MKSYTSAKEKLFETPETVFTVLTKEEKMYLLENTDCKNYKKNELIFLENTLPTGLICLVEGKAKIFKEGAGNRDQIIRLSKPGGFIGYRALFAEQNYSASAMAIENCITCTIEKAALFSVMRKNSDFAFAILKSLAKELGVSNMRTVSLTQKHIRGRLAESLLFLIENYGFAEDGKTIKALLSREDLASLSNMTTSNAIRTLSAFAQEGVISVEGRRIKVNDLNKLQRISNLG